MQISQRTQANQHADEVDSSSLYALTPVTPEPTKSTASSSSETAGGMSGASSTSKPSVLPDSDSNIDPLVNLTDFSTTNFTLFPHVVDPAEGSSEEGDGSAGNSDQKKEERQHHLPKEAEVRPVTLFWDEPASPNGLILYYWLRYRKVVTESKEGESPVSDFNELSNWNVCLNSNSGITSEL